MNNQSGGSISGANFGVYVGGGSAATNRVTNSGTISGKAANGVGVVLGAGDSVNNQSGGTIMGVAGGVSLTGGTISVINSGHIYGTAASGNGITLNTIGSMTNTGTISGGGIGVLVGGGAGTVDQLRLDHGDGLWRPRLCPRRRRDQPDRRNDRRRQLRRVSSAAEARRRTL